MGNDAYDRTSQGMLKGILSRLRTVELRLLRSPTLPDPTGGTTAERDGFWGLPTSAAERVLLANQAPVWFNTTKGWWEGYYVRTDQSGLTVRGLISSYPDGWYPMAGTLLVARRSKTDGFQGFSAGALATPSLDPMHVNIGGFVNSGQAGIAVPVAGMYEIRGAAYFSGGGAADYVLARLLRAGIEVRADQMPKSATGDVTRSVEVKGLDVAAGQTVSLGGSSSVGTFFFGSAPFNGTMLEVEYLGPPIAKV